MPKATLVRKVHEYDDVLSLHFDAPGIDYRAGMYAHLLPSGVFPTGNVRELSFASAPYEDGVFFTVHTSTGSRAKRHLSLLQPGETVRLFGIRGHIGLPDDPNQQLVFVGGGVGVASLRSLIIDARHRGGYDMKMLQVQRGEFLFRSELEPAVNEYQAVSPEQYLKSVRRTARESIGALFYVSGSARLIEATTAALAAADVPRSQMRIEKF